MSKIILTCILALSINFGAMKKSDAAVAGVVAIAGGAAAGSIAYLGLSSMAAGFTLDEIDGNDGWFAIIGLMVGLVFLDENGNAELQLNNISETQLLAKGLTAPEVIAVLDNLEELESVFNTSTTNDQTTEESALRWAKAQEVYGEDAVSGFYKTLTQV